ncbi:MAG: hypothetical protein NZO58_14050, partial [Gemmataceae bacterium]|nr:hypothetical protein [Gemmataceae bacterium]
MFTRVRLQIGLAVAALALGVVWLNAGGNPDNQKQRDFLIKTFQAGNFKDAYDGLRKLCLDPKNDPMQVGKDLDLAVQALRRLGRVDEADDFREEVIKVHANNWRLLAAAAENYSSPQVEHHGYIVAGKFYRGTKRGGARYVHTVHRDRIRSLQLMDQAYKLVQNEPDKLAVADFYLQYARLLMYAGTHDPWRLQYLSDLSKLPDYEEGYAYYGRGFRGSYNHFGAPVDADGNPVFHHVPKSYEDAKSDGERWRWMLKRCVELNPDKANEVDLWFADFHRGQFGVQTMAYYGFRFGGETHDQEQKTGTFALHTLKDTETIARLATGVKRFSLPDEFNYIKVYERIVQRGRSAEAEKAYDRLAEEYENRRQYPRAAQVWKDFIATYGEGNNSYRQRRLDQIVKNWGRFEPVNMQAAGSKATVEYRFRNGTKVSFEAHAIKVEKLLDDVKAYL